MENSCLEKIIARMEKELAVHKKKYGSNPAHNECPERITLVINMLKSSGTGSSNCESGPRNANTGVRGDEFDSARLLYKLAAELEKEDEKNKGAQKEVEQTRKRGRDMIASQLNEFDGFNR